MSKHMPTPWSVLELTGGDVFSRVDIKAADHSRVASLLRSDYTDLAAVRIKNARLIAAAPELLKALEEAVKAWTYEASQGDALSSMRPLHIRL